MNSGDNSNIPQMASGRHPLEPVGPICLIPAKSTGVSSLCIQFAILVLSCLVSIFFFYHVGGYEYLGWNENATILTPMTRRQLSPVYSDIGVIGGRKLSLYKDENPKESTDESNSTKVIEAVDFNNNSWDDGHNETDLLEDIAERENKTTPTPEFDVDIYKAVPNTTIHIGGIVDSELDLLELIRISTLVYVGMCLLWLGSLLLLLLSIKCEILDMIIANAMILTMCLMYAFVHALFVAVLLYYQYSLERSVSWRTLAIVIGTVVILVATSVIGAFCLALVVTWYKYVVYVKDSEQCSCLAAITSLVKGTKRQRGPHEYAMPEATRPPQVPYMDEERPVQQFSHF